jgi:hypothetical protein
MRSFRCDGPVDRTPANQPRRRLFLALLGAGATWAIVGRRQPATSGEKSPLVPSALDDKVKTTFAIHGYQGVNEAREFGPLKPAIERRGFPCMIVRSPKADADTPNQDRAKVMVEAVNSIQGKVALIGISNQGLFMPLVAAERPVRRIVMINAVVPVSARRSISNKCLRRGSPARSRKGPLARSKSCQRSNTITSAARKTTRYAPNGNSKSRRRADRHQGRRTRQYRREVCG